MPSRLTASEWERLLDLKSVSARRKFYTFLFNCEMTRINLKAKKEEARADREEMIAKLKEENKEKHLVYALGHNSIFLRFYETTLNLWNNNKVATAMKFEQKIVIDCSYDEYMTVREADNCAKQLSYSFAMNRIYDQPFDLHFCNFDINSIAGKKLKNHIPTLLNPEFPMNVHEKSYLDLFDKEKLVYLTPHCRNDLTDYNHDDIYIIGAMVDKSHNEPLSLAKAKKEGLRMARFPLDNHFRLRGGKCLTINQVLDILASMRDTNDWGKSLLKHVPRRKISTVFAQNDQDDYTDEEVNFKTRNNYRNQDQYQNYNNRYKYDNNRYQGGNNYRGQNNDENTGGSYRPNNYNRSSDDSYRQNNYNSFRNNRDESFNNNNRNYNNRNNESFSTNNNRNNYNNRNNEPYRNRNEPYNMSKNVVASKKDTIRKIFDED